MKETPTLPSLGALSTGHGNNLNLIRMILASAVLVSHAVPLAVGEHAVEPLETLLHFSLGGLAVYGFFAISGFLVTQSLVQRADVISYFQARVLRIFPGLAVVLLLTVVVLGPAVTTEGLPQYVSEPKTWTYFISNLSLLRLQYELPGVFLTNPYPNAINGSLWTLPMEFACYVALAAIGVAGGLKKGWRIRLTTGAIALFVVAIALLQYRVHIPDRLEKFAFLSFCFAGGAAFYFWRDHIVLSRRAALVGVALTVAVNWYWPFSYLVCAAYFYALFAFGYRRAPLLEGYNRFGDYSYGMYIYAFPIEQLCAWLFPGISPLALCAASVPPTLMLAILSWYLVERPALSLKRSRSTVRPTPAPQ